MTTTDRPTARWPTPTVLARCASDDDVQHALRFDPRHFGIDPGDPWPDDVPRGQDDSHWRYEDDPRAPGGPSCASPSAGP